LYDLHGNVWEWCQDHWHEDYENAPTDGRAWEGREEGTSRVLRGGAWFFTAEYCRSAYRFRYDPDFRDYYFGFRLVRLPAHRAWWMPAC
jgi:formylglycine-generating enzyme required for sulfatase activity